MCREHAVGVTIDARMPKSHHPTALAVEREMRMLIHRGLNVYEMMRLL